MEGEDNDNTDEGNAAADNNKGGNSAIAGGGGKDKQSNGKATITKAPSGKGLTNNSGGKGKQLSNMAGNPNAANENNNNRKRSVSFSVDRQSSNITTDGGIMDDGTNMMIDNGSLNNDAVILGRWHAPYLKDISTFPITGPNSEDIANPHRLPGSQISLSMHDYATEMEACRESTTTAALKRRGSSSGVSDAASSATAKAKKLQADMVEKSMRMALRIPDDVYAKKDMVWGAIKDSNADDDTLMPDTNSKKSAGEKKLDGGKATTMAKVKFDPSTKQQSESSLNELSGPQIHRPSYVPNFLPPFPTNEYSDLANERLSASISTSSVMGDVMSRMHHRKEKRKASDISSTSADDNDQKKKKINSSERDSVRRSVIGLGKKSVGTSHWGSNWLDDDNAEAGGQGGGTHTKSNNIGLSDVTGAASVEEGGNTVAAASPKKSNIDVQPLVRASGSRLSKILEGSMI